MEILADYVEGKQFRAIGSSEYHTVVDAKAVNGGTGLGATPMEMVLMALATCSGMDIVTVLNKMRIPFDKLQIVVRGEQAAVEPRVFTEIEITYRFGGQALPQNKIDSAIKLVLDKYCPVAVMLKQVAALNYTLECNPS
ncbi:putative redox protein, regulator of disulfide bond formation [Desulfosporosinus orientis DSM 765]|uniref:Putative redox protein, regulator of disulfide bond formation n=1 Tax=Desulfosporosinus orientis (strain ATCC 19365 / DSM 765 / NCIMB 8382 / VKM B-1628 / Singapore I) TaxID=768706 RepID=G7WD99_DESOD|nr:OsmC family protein [Desulfosporosinus orientis]AET67584.1 putative redox protein, regulator of disulfide bond formation [Desulfosporosinus orientis DSM 765]